MDVKENGVLSVDVFDKGEALDDAIFDYEETEECKKLLKLYHETKDETYYKKYCNGMDKYLKDKGLIKSEN